MSEREGQKPLPRCKMSLLCEGITTDETTRRWTIHGLIDGFEIPRSPAATGPFVGFVWLVDGIGSYEARVEIQDCATAKVLPTCPPGSLILPIDSNPQLLCFENPSLTLPYEEFYDFVAYADGEEIDRWQFWARPKETSHETSDEA